MKKTVKWVSGIIVVLILLVWFVLRFVLSFSVATYDGSHTVGTLSGQVSIDYDSMAVPQIWAKTDKDMYFALGWTHASERLFQMELIRRVATGTLAEIFGDRALKFDILQRKIGFARKAYRDIENLDPRYKEYLQSYCDGINEWIRTKSILPPEFFILGFTPTKWKPKHVAAIMLYQTWFAHYLMDHDRQYTEMLNKLGKDVFQLMSRFKNWSPSTVPFDEKNGLLTQVSMAFNMSFASNSWAVAPAKTSSGKPIHESDPHLQINSIPGFWYLVGLHSYDDGTDVVGITVPSIPFVVMGHNRNVAFAFTVASVDLNDYYREKLNPEDSLSVLTANGYEKVQTVRDSIIVKGWDKPLYLTLLRTSHGSVIQKDSTSLLTLKWAGMDFDVSKIIESGFKLHNIRNFTDFRETVTSLGALDVNWTYSDKRGNIGYQLGAPIPIREFENTFQELPGENSKYEWKGYVPLEKTPFVLNPSQNFVATSNNQIVPPNWEYRIPGFYDPYRIVRETDLLRKANSLTLKGAAKIQQDLVSVKALRWKKLLAKGAELIGEKELADSIDNWDARMTINSMPAGVFTIWWYYLVKEIFQDDLGKDWAIGRFIVEETLSDTVSRIIDNKFTENHVETIDEISSLALDSVLIYFGKPKLKDISVHKLVHPLGTVGLLNAWLDFNRGPFSVAGDNSTIAANFNAYNKKEKEFEAVIGPSMRYLLDWAKPDSFLIIVNLGESGNPFSSHYDDFLSLMRSGKYWVVPITKAAVEKRTVSKFILK